jgi:hypothetical protein
VRQCCNSVQHDDAADTFTLRASRFVRRTGQRKRRFVQIMKDCARRDEEVVCRGSTGDPLYSRRSDSGGDFSASELAVARR